MKLFLLIMLSLNLLANSTINDEIKRLNSENKELKQNNSFLEKTMRQLEKEKQTLIKEQNNKKLDAVRVHEGKLLIEQAGNWTIHMPWIGAIFIGLFSAIVSLLIVKKQSKINKDVSLLQNKMSKEISTNEIKAKLLAGNRQNWINDLRNNISLFLSKMTILYLDYGDNYRKVPFDDRCDIFDKSLEIEINNVIYKIELLINPREEESRYLIEGIKELYDNYKKIDEYNDFELKLKFIVQTSQAILKKEWERVKKNS